MASRDMMMRKKTDRTRNMIMSISRMFSKKPNTLEQSEERENIEEEREIH